MTRVLPSERFVGAAALSALLAPAPAAAEDVFPFPVHERTLENGMRMVAVPYESPGLVSFYLVVRTGSRDEVEPGHSGFAHFFEHMMFRGTEQYSPNAYNDVLEQMGVDANASTWEDRTVYPMTGPFSGHMDSHFYGMPYFIDEIEKRLATMSAADVNRAIRRYLQTDDFVAVIITGDGHALARRLAAPASPVEYTNPVAADVLGADREILEIPLDPASVRVVPIERTFTGGWRSAAEKK